MPPKTLKKTERDAVASFRGITSANEETAVRCLTQHRWRMDSAVDGYFQNPDIYFVAPALPPTDAVKIKEMFDVYKDPADPGCVGGDGLVKFCADLGVEPDDEVMIAFSFKMGAAEMGEFAEKEWLSGCQQMGLLFFFSSVFGGYLFVRFRFSVQAAGDGCGRLQLLYILHRSPRVYGRHSCQKVLTPLLGCKAHSLPCEHP